MKSIKFLSYLTHLGGPQLQQQSSRLRLVIGSFFPQELPVGVEPRAGAQAFGETRRSQEFPESLLNTLSCLLLLCRIEKISKVLVNSPKKRKRKI